MMGRTHCWGGTMTLMLLASITILIQQGASAAETNAVTENVVAQKTIPEKGKVDPPAVEAPVLDKSAPEITVSEDKPGADKSVAGNNTESAKVVTEIKIDMYVGELRVLSNMDIKRVAVGNGSIVKVRQIPGNELLFIADGVGDTAVHLWDRKDQETHINLHVATIDPKNVVKMEDMILLEVRIIEFSSSKLSELGIRWQSAIAGPGAAVAGDLRSNSLFRGTADTGVFGGLPTKVVHAKSYFGLASEITSRINLMISNGDAFTIAEPTLTCRNGGEAKFLAGGEVPIPVPGPNNTVTIAFKEYGIKLNIQPIADDQGTIATKLLTEVSRVDTSVSVSGVPGFLTRRTETEMNVKQNETIVISGLVNAEDSKAVDKLPGLGDIPVFGSLFRSNKFKRSKTELVVFVTPRIFRVNSEKNKKMIESYTKKADSRQGEISRQIPTKDLID